MRKNLKQLAQAAKEQQNTTASAAIMTVAPTEAGAEQPTTQDAAPVDETPEQPSPLALATDQPEQPAVPALPVPIFTPLLAPQLPRSMEELLQIVGKAKSLTDRLTGLKSTNEKLGSFEVGREGFTDRLTLRDGNGQEWNTTQGVVIQKVLDVLRGELRGSINSAEAELRQLLPAA